MPTMPAGRKTHLVTLDDEDARTFIPDKVWVAIRSSSPSTLDESHITYQVTMDYHKDVSLNTRLTLLDGSRLIVRGYEDVERRHVELNLLCEEVGYPD